MTFKIIIRILEKPIRIIMIQIKHTNKNKMKKSSLTHKAYVYVIKWSNHSAVICNLIMTDSCLLLSCHSSNHFIPPCLRPSLPSHHIPPWLRPSLPSHHAATRALAGPGRLSIPGSAGTMPSFEFVCLSLVMIVCLSHDLPVSFFYLYNICLTSKNVCLSDTFSFCGILKRAIRLFSFRFVYCTTKVCMRLTFICQF